MQDNSKCIRIIITSLKDVIKRMKACTQHVQVYTYSHTSRFLIQKRR